MKLRDANLQVYEKNSLTYPPSCILPSRTHHNCFFRRDFESMRVNFLSGNISKVVLLVVCLFNYDSSKSTSSMLNVAFDFVLITVFVK